MKIIADSDGRCLYSFEKCIITVHAAIFRYRMIKSGFSKQDSKMASYTNSCSNYI